MNINYKDWLSYASNRLFLYSDTPVLDAEILLQHVTKKSKSYIFTFEFEELSLTQEKYLEKLLFRRFKGEPIAYLIGNVEFYSLSLIISKKVFIPRLDTEFLVEKFIDIKSKYLKSSIYKVLDLGTGVGSIALSIAKEDSSSIVFGVDINKFAVNLACLNSERLSIKNVFFL